MDRGCHLLQCSHFTVEVADESFVYMMDFFLPKFSQEYNLSV